ncbi:MAG: HNH endonuclease [Thermodesulfovibrionales bacterium]|nr:HNH endonuclease [Thermodesulfovibrionales bacterium]
MQRFISEVTEEEIKRQRAKARALRVSAWWKKKRSRGDCYFCGRKFPPPELTMEHIVPIIRGGKSEKGNLVPACKDCNSRKKHMLPMEWEEYMEKLKSGPD